MVVTPAMSGGPAVPVYEMSGLPGQARHDDVSDGGLRPVAEAVNSPGLSGRMSGFDHFAVIHSYRNRAR